MVIAFLGASRRWGTSAWDCDTVGIIRGAEEGRALPTTGGAIEALACLVTSVPPVDDIAGHTSVSARVVGACDYAQSHRRVR